MYKNHKVFLIVAVDQKWGIGKDGQMPWHFRSEMKYFAETTTNILSSLKPLENKASNKQNAVIMGRTTWESLPEQYRPLPGRANIVMTRNPQYKLYQDSDISKKSEKSTTGYGEAQFIPRVVSSFSEALEVLDSLHLLHSQEIENIFIIGGASIYKESLENKEILEKLDGIYLTKIQKTFDCDTFFPDPTERFPNQKILKTEKEKTSSSEEPIEIQYLFLEK